MATGICHCRVRATIVAVTDVATLAYKHKKTKHTACIRAIRTQTNVINITDARDATRPECGAAAGVKWIDLNNYAVRNRMDRPAMTFSRRQRRKSKAFGSTRFSWESWVERCTIALLCWSNHFCLLSSTCWSLRLWSARSLWSCRSEARQSTSVIDDQWKKSVEYMKLRHGKGECCISWFAAILSKHAKENDCHSIALILFVCSLIAHCCSLIVLEVQQWLDREAFETDVMLQCEISQNKLQK